MRCTALLEKSITSAEVRLVIKTNRLGLRASASKIFRLCLPVVVVRFFLAGALNLCSAELRHCHARSASVVVIAVSGIGSQESRVILDNLRKP